MAHYATINEQNTVIAINTGVDETDTQIDTDGTQVGGSTEAWEAFYTAQLKNPNLIVKRCSYHGNIRGKYPAIGDTWNGTNFIAPKPFPSWTLDSNNDWQSPTPMPSTGGPYRWSEEDLEWVAI